MPAISKIILGTVQFGLDYGINNNEGKPGQEQVNEMLTYAYDAGVQCLDTAEAYGNAHGVIGQFHQRYPDKKFEVITKLPHQLAGDLGMKIDDYIKELAVSCLHGLLFHSYQTYKDNLGLIKVLNEYKTNNKVKHLGVSVYTNEQFADVIEDDNIDIIQLPFNLFDNYNLRGQLLEKAKERGKIIHTRSAFLQGLFFTSIEKDNKIIKALIKELGYIQELSKVSGIPLNKMALNYCLQQNHIDAVLIGVDNISQLKQNLNDGDGSLSKNQLEMINKIEVKDVELLNPALWNL
ncbi:aldo/keto reductase [Pedobacter gandavensis]|uniref:aldo/keto reductase n=1 Tax=Pedobacter gandavensis TaxID=2679963 RepID=UPI0015FFACD5|nr:aldo/keto reductase [Pedobacter gandavensis]